MVSKFYAVRRGANPGIYRSWTECNKQVFKFPMARFRSFETVEEAELFMAGRSHSNNPAIKHEEKQLDVRWSRPLEAAKRTPSSIQRGAVRQAVENSYARAISRGESMNIDVPPPRVFTYPPRGPIKRLFPKIQFDPSYFSPLPGHIYIDGSCINNGQYNARAGVGVFFGPGNRLNLSERLRGQNQTSCRAEIMAAIRALEITALVSVHPHTHSASVAETIQRMSDARALADLYRNPTIVTDCQYLIDAESKYMQQWLLTGRTNSGRVPKNLDLLMRLSELTVDRRYSPTPFCFCYLPPSPPPPPHTHTHTHPTTGSLGCTYIRTLATLATMQRICWPRQAVWRMISCSWS